MSLYPLHNNSDNINYMARDTRLSINGETRGTLEAGYSAYEVPVSSTMQLIQNNRENCQSLEATYALPDTYEYATQGPNEAKV